MAFVIRPVPGWKGNLDVFVEGVVDNVGDDVRDDAGRLSPVLTGSLSHSFVANQLGHGINRVVQVGVDEDYYGPGGEHPADYQEFVENGTSIMAAQPHLKPALYQNRSVRRG